LPDESRPLKRATIKDIARAAKLSVSTVSRALSNHPRISEKTKREILALADQMGYTPNQFARGLVQRKTFLIGLLVYDFRNPFYGELTRSIQETVEEHGYWVIQASTDDDDQKSRSLVRSMIELGVEGIIFASCKLNDPLVESLLEDNFPLVLANRRLKKNKGDHVIVDNAYGAYLIVNHLINLGYRRIGTITGPRNLSTGADRYRGYLKALEDKGLDIDEEIIMHGNFFSQDTGYRFTREMMRLAKPPEAVFCCDDYIALGSMKAIGELDRRVPDDLAVVGFDDVEISSHPFIQLTTVSQDVKRMGKLAAQCLVERIEGKDRPPTRIVLEPQLVIRQSCGYKMMSRRSVVQGF
jgi:LacI family transcriptional regulator